MKSPSKAPSAVLVGALLAGAAPWALAAGADTVGGRAASVTSVLVTQAAPAAARPSAFQPGRAVASIALAMQRGGTAATDGLSLTGSVAGSSATNVTTGANSISDGAFTGVNGLPMVVQNTGNNVVIQTSTIVNVTIK